MAERRVRGPYAKSAGRRAEILRAAKDAISEHGYAKASLRDIAERVGLTHAGLQYYYPTKEAILTALLDERDADNDRRGRQRNRATPDGPAATLADIITESVRGHLETPELTGLWAELTVAARNTDHPAHDHFADRFEYARALIAERLSSRGAAGALPGGLTAAECATLFVAVIEGLQTQWLLDPALDIISPLAKFTRLMDDPAPDDARRGSRGRTGD